MSALPLFAALERPTPQGEWSGSELGEVLSPSQTRIFLDCPARWYFKFVRNLPDPQTAALALGTAFHQAIKANFRHKQERHEDLPTTEVLDLFRNAWGELKTEAVFADEEDPTEMGLVGEKVVITYMEQAAPSIRPSIVERPCSGTIAGVKVRGQVDLLDTEGVVIDSKTASKSPTGISADYQLQLITYTMLIPEASGTCRLDTVTKTKTPKLVPQTFYAGEPQKRYAENIYPMVQESIREGIFIPNRNSHLCSRKNCAFWRDCEREFGGEVDAS